LKAELSTLRKMKKSRLGGTFCAYSAEREGFEPPEVLPSTVFKTAAIDHSAISPAAKIIKKMKLQIRLFYFA
jgi:hypothetical protein